MEKTKNSGGIRKRAPNAFISDLEKRLASFERIHSSENNNSSNQYPAPESVAGSEDRYSSLEPPVNHALAQESQLRLDEEPNQSDVAGAAVQHQERARTVDPPNSGTHVESSRTSPGPQLINPLALGYSAYISDALGQPVYLGTSSNWAFCRRVLAMTHERVFHAPVPPETLLYEGKVYDLGWNDPTMLSASSNVDMSALPSADFAIYLIDAVKFHCGQFHLFDDEVFMHHFERFHDPNVERSTIPQLWYVHYLLVIAFGKAFVVRMNKGGRPPGAELFVQAMKLLPLGTLFVSDPVETIETICCAALYAQSLDFRCLAYRLALRIALEAGMHTKMQSQHVDKRHVERCRKAWWTTYLLDRQMSSLMGVPMAIRDEDIGAELPALPGSPQKIKALDLHVKLSRVIAQIFNTIYGSEVNLDKRFVLNIKSALKSIADVTDELNGSFPISTSGSMAGVTRLSAYLHLLHHQCILLATRPLLFTFLDMRLNSPELTRSPVPRRGSVRALLHMCIESAQQILRMLSGLQEQSLLESFLPFDLDPTFTSAIVSLMVAAVDPRILEDDTPWLQIAFSVLDEMICRGNLIAAFLKSELQQLEVVIRHLPPITHHGKGTMEDTRYQQQPRVGVQPQQNPKAGDDGTLSSTSQTLIDHPSISDDFSVPDVDWHAGVNTEHLMMVADSLDLDGFNWLPGCFTDIPTQH